MAIRGILRTSVVLLSVACSSADVDAGRIQAQIEHELQLGMDATRSEDIDAYMAGFPDDLRIVDESGAVITREEQRANVLRDWAIIDSTISIEIVVDSLEAFPDSAVVFTSQRWERLMFQRDGLTLDTVVTTQRHRESWKRTEAGWRGYHIQELGGLVWINGRPYSP